MNEQRIANYIANKTKTYKRKYGKTPYDKLIAKWRADIMKELRHTPKEKKMLSLTEFYDEMWG